MIDSPTFVYLMRSTSSLLSFSKSFEMSLHSDTETEGSITTPVVVDDVLALDVQEAKRITILPEGLIEYAVRCNIDLNRIDLSNLPFGITLHDQSNHRNLCMESSIQKTVLQILGEDLDTTSSGHSEFTAVKCASLAQLCTHAVSTSALLITSSPDFFSSYGSALLAAGHDLDYLTIMDKSNAPEHARGPFTRAMLENSKRSVQGLYRSITTSVRANSISVALRGSTRARDKLPALLAPSASAAPRDLSLRNKVRASHSFTPSGSSVAAMPAPRDTHTKSNRLSSHLPDGYRTTRHDEPLAPPAAKQDFGFSFAESPNLSLALEFTDPWEGLAGIGCAVSNDDSDERMHQPRPGERSDDTFGRDRVAALADNVAAATHASAPFVPLLLPAVRHKTRRTMRDIVREDLACGSLDLDMMRIGIKSY